MAPRKNLIETVRQADTETETGRNRGRKCVCVLLALTAIRVAAVGGNSNVANTTEPDASAPRHLV